ncbi:hypothetical protein IAT38_003610 [Cryptococcus sp. DSM 104549]
MKYSYTYLDEFFAPSHWENDFQGPFGMTSGVFKDRIDELKAQCPEGESIKVVFAARHGQAEHNLLKEKYGLPPDVVHIAHPILDPQLTPIGESKPKRWARPSSAKPSEGCPCPRSGAQAPCGELPRRVGLSGSGCMVERRNRGVGCLLLLSITFERSSTCTNATGDYQSQTSTNSFRLTQEELVARLRDVFEECLNANISLTSHYHALRGLYTALGVPTRKMAVSEMNVLVLRVKRADDH